MAITSILTSPGETNPTPFPAETSPTPFPTPTTTPSARGTPRLGPPQAIYSPYPEYDSDWNKKALQGKCIVRLTIDPTTGVTTGVKIEKSSGSKELDGAALAACSNWRFKPWSYPQLTIPFEFRPAKTTTVSTPSARYTAKPGTSKPAPAPAHNLYQFRNAARTAVNQAPPDQRQALLGGLLGALKGGGGGGLGSIAGRLGLSSTDPNQMSEDDATKVMNYARKENPDALRQTVQEKPWFVKALGNPVVVGALTMAATKLLSNQRKGV